MKRNSKNASFLKKEEFTSFIRILVDYIKEKMRIVHNNFDKYHDVIRKNFINVNEIIKELSLKEVLINLMQKANILVNNNNVVQTRRCIEVISFALLKCRDYRMLKNMLKVHTKLSDNSIRRMIKKYIPFLKKINRNIDINSWIPIQKSANFTEQEINNIAIKKNIKLLSNYSDYKNRESILKWECINCGFQFNSKVRHVKEAVYPCLECREQLSRKYNFESYQNCLSEYIEKFINLLLKDQKFESIIPEIIKNNLLKMFQDVLNLFNFSKDNDKFLKFYKKMGNIPVKGPKFLAAALIYIFLKKKDISITQKSISHIIKVSSDHISLASSHFINLLKQIPNYDFIFDLIKSKKMNMQEYTTEVKNYLEIFHNYLNNTIEFYNISNNELDEIYKIFLDAINSIPKLNKYNVYLNYFERNKPYIHASIIFYIYLKYQKDYDIQKNNFCRLLNIGKSSFIQNYKIFYDNFFKLDEKKYLKKVLEYFRQYIIKIINWIPNYKKDSKEVLKWLKNNNFSLVQELIKSSEKEILVKATNLFSKIREKGFEIIYFSGNIKYLFPQYMALTFLYYIFKSNNELKVLASKRLFIYLFGINDKFKKYINTINKSENPLLSYIREILGRLSGQHYNREYFIKYLKQNLKKHYHLETEFFLNLYQPTNFTPQEFGEKLNIYGSQGLKGVLKIIKNQYTISEPQVFLNIKNFIQKHIPINNQSEFVDMIDNINVLNKKDFDHQGITYRFQLNYKHINMIHNIQMKTLINNYFNLIFSEQFPRYIFLSDLNPRASNFKFQGSQIPYQPIHTKLILNYFKNKLKRYSNSHPLILYAKEVFNKYHQKKIGKKPDHAPILQYTLLEYKNAIATEIPVWMQIPNSEKFYVGHIDLLLINENEIIIADFKQSKAEVLKHIPQLMIYALMLKHQLLKKRNTNSIIFKCIGYTKNIALEFDPLDIQKNILKFINQYNVLKNRLLPDFKPLFI